MYKIRADMRLSNEENRLAYGTVTIQGNLRFTVTVRKYLSGSGEEKVFISYPRILKKEGWQNVLTIGPELKEQILETVGRALKEEITKDLYLPDIEEVRVTPIPEKVHGKAVICAIANIKICGITIHGLTIKRGEKGYMVNMPQFKTASGKWQDAVYGTNLAMQQKIKNAVLEAYQDILAESGKEQT